MTETDFLLLSAEVAELREQLAALRARVDQPAPPAQVNVAAPNVTVQAPSVTVEAPQPAPAAPACSYEITTVGAYGKTVKSIVRPLPPGG